MAKQRVAVDRNGTELAKVLGLPATAAHEWRVSRIRFRLIVARWEMSEGLAESSIRHMVVDGI